MANKGKPVEAVAYIRTSSAANVGADKDSDKRQRAAIESFAKRMKCSKCDGQRVHVMPAWDVLGRRR